MTSIGKIIATALAIVLFLFFSPMAKGDTLVSMSDIQFHSEFEKVTFCNILENNQLDYLALYLAGDSTVTMSDFYSIEQSFQQMIEKYNSNKYRKLRNSKQVKRVYLDVHETLLDKYDQEKGFSAVFQKGEYQCVTASMLFSIVFDRLNIPYEIKLLPTHTYLVAYPDTDYVLVETTDPVKGTVVFDDRYKEDYINFLRDRKLISQEDYDNQEVGELFDRYYMEIETIDQKQLAGAQYYNLSLVAMAERDFITGYNFMEKAYLLHPSSKNNFMLLFALANALNELSITDADYSKYLGKLMRFHKQGATTDQLFGMFSNLTNRQLLFEGNTLLYDESYTNIISEVQDSSLRADIQFLYNYERGRALFLNTEYEIAEPYVGKAFSLKPNSADVKAMFFGIMLSRLEDLKYGEEAYSLQAFEEYFSSISEMKNKYSQLDNMKGFQKAWLFFCLGLIEQFYQQNDSENGEKYMLIFESNYPNSLAGYEGINKSIATAYTSAADFYNQNNNLLKSHEIANKGLSYIPGNSALKFIADFSID